MTANFEPLDGGVRTRVTTSVARGDAPDDVVSPAFRSTGITSGLFALAVEGELNKLTDPPHAAAADCRKMIEDWRDAAIDDPRPRDEPHSLGQAISAGARNVIKLQAMEDALRRRGCPIDGGGKFKDVSSEMRPADDDDQPAGDPRARDTARVTDTAGDGLPDE